MVLCSLLRAKGLNCGCDSTKLRNREVFPNVLYSEPKIDLHLFRMIHLKLFARHTNRVCVGFTVTFTLRAWCCEIVEVLAKGLAASAGWVTHCTQATTVQGDFIGCRQSASAHQATLLVLA